MNYAEARQIKDGPNVGRWHWTVRNDKHIRSEGYCSPWATCATCKGMTGILRPDNPCNDCESKGIVRKAEPCPGHDTPEQAEEHFRQYQVDNAHFIVVEDTHAHSLHKCKVAGCETFTASYMTITGDAYAHWIVCPAHHMRETADSLITRSSSAMYS